jgi:hypothetical protein
LVLHIIPFSAFDSEATVDVAQFQGQYLAPIWCSGYNYGYNVEGYWTASDGEGLCGYVQVFRNGIIETAAADVRTESPRGRLLYSASVETQVIRSVDKCMSALAHVGMAPPVLVVLSGVRMQGTIVIGSPLAPLIRAQPLRSDALFPAIRIESFGTIQEYTQALKPIFDALWNAAGYASSQSYGADGIWNRGYPQ